MKRLLPPLAFLAFVLFFLIANRGAYRGYFDGDDLDNISWSRAVAAGDAAKALLNPVLGESNYRAAGQFMYVVLGRTQLLHYAPYIGWIHAVHLLTVIVVYCLLRKLEFAALPAALGTLFFGFDMAAFDVYWKPMYVYDLSCGLFCALALLAWLYDRWIVSLICFWLAFKCKELAVMLPFVLLAYEYILGQRRWKRVMPCLAIAVLVTAQAALANGARQNAYSFHFTPGALWTTLRFYAPHLFFIPILAALGWSRRTWFGLAMTILLPLPLLFLPGRLFTAYLYVPLLGLAVIAASIRPQLALAALLLWLPWNFIQMRQKRVPLIAAQHESQRYAEAVANFIRAHGKSRAYVFDGQPAEIHPWGVNGLLHILGGDDAIVETIESPAGRTALRERSLTVIRWYPAYKKAGLLARRPDTPDRSYLTMGPDAPDWQLDEGWYGFEGGYRWIRPRATATLLRPANAATFELTVLVGPQLIAVDKQVRVTVLANGQPLGDHTYTNHGLQTVSWRLKDRSAGPVRLEFRVDPVYQGEPDGSHPLGIAIGGFGYK